MDNVRIEGETLRKSAAEYDEYFCMLKYDKKLKKKPNVDEDDYYRGLMAGIGVKNYKEL